MKYLIFEPKTGEIQIFGDTYPVRDILKQLGARWLVSGKRWVLPHDAVVWEQLLRLGFLPQEQETRGNEGAAGEIDDGGRETLSVGAFLERASAVVRRECGAPVWLLAEILAVKISGSHCYFELGDQPAVQDLSGERRIHKQLVQGKSSSLNAVLWSDRRRLLEERWGELPLQEGASVRVKGSLDLRKEGARLQFIVEDVDVSYAEGQQALLRKRLRLELKKRGLFEENRRRQLPGFPLKVGLITAANSRAYGDFCDEIRSSGLSFEIFFIDVHMQGAEVSGEVSAAVRLLGELKFSDGSPLDCLVLTRGGGSRADLRWFDDIEIAKAVCSCSVPVLSAIGHFDDQSIVDEIASVSVKTPTAAAHHLVNAVKQQLGRAGEAVQRAADWAGRRIERARQNLLSTESRLASASAQKIHREKNLLETSSRLLKAYQKNSARMLERGFCLVKNENGDVLNFKDLSELQSSDKIVIQTERRHEDHRERLMVSAQINSIIVKREPWDG